MPRPRYAAGFGPDRLAVSDTFPELVEPIPPHLEGNAARLSRNVLAPLASWASGQSLELVVDSGYRPPDLNAAVGGSASSLHLQASAADVYFVDAASRRIVPDAAVRAARWADRALTDVGEIIVKSSSIHITTRQPGQDHELLVEAGGDLVPVPSGRSSAWPAILAWAGATLVLLGGVES